MEYAMMVTIPDDELRGDLSVENAARTINTLCGVEALPIEVRPLTNDDIL